MLATGLRLPDQSNANWKWVSRTGSVVNEILGEAREQDVDLIVMTTAGRHGLLDALRGSATEQIVENARCPILAVHSWVD
ncbi:MAG: universal stress protein [Planctomycetota bacterium]